MPLRFGCPSRSGTHLLVVPMGPPLFRTDPVCLDMRQCLRKVTLGQAFRQHVLPADPGEAIGTFDDKDFGVFPHTSVHIPVYASYPALPRRTQDSVTTAMPLAWWAGFHAGLDRVQLSERTPAFLTAVADDRTGIGVAGAAPEGGQ